MKTKRASAMVSTLDEEARSFDVIASTEAEDSHGEIIAQDWKLDRYKRNPVVFFGHESRDLPIGKASDVRVEDGKLQARVTLVSAAANPRAEQVLQLMREGALCGVSVGFRPGKRSVARRKDGSQMVTLSGNELMELSVVGIPANAEAHAKDQGQRGAGAEERHMDEMTKALGLQDGAAEEDIAKAFADASSALLEATGAKSLGAAVGAVEALKAKCEAYKAEAEDARAKLGAIEAKQAADALESTLDEAVRAGKITPAARAGYAEKAAKFGADWLVALVAELPVKGGTKDGAAIAAPDAGAVAIDRELAAVLERVGLTEDDYREAVKAGKV